MQEPVALHAQVNERCLERRLHVDDAAFIDVTCLLALTLPFQEDLRKLAVLQDRHAHLARLGRVQ